MTLEFPFELNSLQVLKDDDVVNINLLRCIKSHLTRFILLGNLFFTRKFVLLSSGETDTYLKSSRSKSMRILIQGNLVERRCQ